MICPHCGKETVLSVPVTNSAERRSSNDSWSFRVSKRVALIAGIALLSAAVLVPLVVSKAIAASQRSKAVSQARHRFAVELSSLLTALNGSASPQSVATIHGAALETDLRLWARALTPDERDKLGRLIDELGGVQFFARKSANEKGFAGLSLQDREHLARHGLMDAPDTWQIWLIGVDKQHPVMRSFDESWLKIGFDPNSGAGMKAKLEYADKMVSDAKQSREYYNADACYSALLARARNSAETVFASLSK